MSVVGARGCLVVSGYTQEQECCAEVVGRTITTPTAPYQGGYRSPLSGALLWE